MKHIILLLLFLSVDLLTAQQDKNTLLEELMAESISCKGKKRVCNMLLYAKNAKSKFEFNRGLGVVGRSEAEIDESFQYKIASITKTMVATTVLQMAEEGKINIDDPIKKYLEYTDFVNYDNLHIYKGVKSQDSITIRMLLNHTSGILDIFNDAEVRFYLGVYFNKKKEYTAEEIFKKYFDYKLNKKPANLPGRGYNYSDINYMLLGFIIEEVAQKSLSDVLRERIITPLELENTYFEYYEAARGIGQMTDSYLNRTNITEKINTSFEWAGGGIVSTVEEMAVFIQAIFNEQLLNTESLNNMMDISSTAKFGEKYGLGLEKFEIKNKVFYGHSGAYGSLLLYSPAEELTISLNVGQGNPPFSLGKLVYDISNIIGE